MDIIVFSDSHGHPKNMIKALERHGDIKYAIHLGDYGCDISYVLEHKPDLPCEVVQGNNDKIKDYPIEKVFTIAGKRIFITHGHIYNVGRGMEPLTAKGRKENADVVLYGHTHMPHMETRNGILLLNPGSIFRQRLFSGPTYAVIELVENEIRAEIIKI